MLRLKIKSRINTTLRGERGACFPRPDPGRPVILIRIELSQAWQDVRVISCKRPRDLSRGKWRSSTSHTSSSSTGSGMDGAVLSHFPRFYFPRLRKKKGQKEKEEGEKTSPLPLRETLRNYVSSRKNVIYGVCSSFLAVGYIFFLCVF